MATAEEVLPLIKKAEGYPTSSTISKPDPRGGRGGAVGVNQVMPETATAYGFDPKRLHEDDYNDTVAKYVISDLHSKFGSDDLKSTLIGYNAGPGMVQRWQQGNRNDSLLPAQTREYIQRAGLPLNATPIANRISVPDGKPKADFIAAQSRAGSQSLDAQWNSLLAPEKPPTGQQPGQQPTTPTSYVDPNTPFGVQVENYGSNFLRAARNAMASAEIPKAPASLVDAVGAHYLGGMAGAWEKLKNDYLDQVGANREAGKTPGWNGLKKSFETAVRAGKLPLDAFNLVMSPVSAAIDTGAHEAGQAGEKITGGAVSSKTIEDAINLAMLGIAPAKGLGATLAETARAGETAEAAAAAGEGGPPGGGAGATEGAEAFKTNPAKIAQEHAEDVSALETQAFKGAAAKAAPATQEKSFTFGGDERPEPTEADRTSAAKFLNGEEPDNPVRIAMDRLITPETRNQAVNDIAKIIPVDQVKPIDVTMMNAYSLQMHPDEIMAAIRPRFAQDDLYYAAGTVLNSAGKQAWEAARTFAESGTPEDYEKAVRAYTIANKYLGDFRSAKTDWGRAGRIQQELTTDYLHYSRAIQATIDSVGSENMEEAIRKIGSLDDPAKAPALLSSMRRFSGRDGILYGWYNILLSNPRTIIKKLTSDALMATWNVAARYSAEKFSGGAVPHGEAAQLLYGYSESMNDAIRAAGKALKAGSSQFQPDYQTVEGINRYRTSMLASGIDPSAAPSVTADTANFLRSMLPTSWIGAADDFAKTLGYGAEKRAAIFRRATNEAAADSAVNPAERIQDMMNNVPEDIHEQAVQAANSKVFQDPLTPFSSAIRDVANKFSIPVGKSGFEIPLGRIILPIVRIPANIVRFNYRASPLPLMFPTQGYLDELRMGGARAALARAGVGLGTAAALTGVGLAYSGMTTGEGPSDPDLRRAWLQAGNQPYSIRVGGKWYSYRSVEPVGFMLGAISDIADLARFSKQQDTKQMMASFVFGAGNALLNASYLGGFSDFLEALREPDQEGNYFIDNLLSTIAAPIGVAGLAQVIDPWKRAHRGLLQAIEAKLPYLSEGLPPQRTTWGDPIPWSDGFLPPISGTGAARMLSPVQIAPDTAQPIDTWIWDHRQSFPRSDQNRIGINKVSRVISLSKGPATAQYELSDKEYDRYQVLAGNALKDPKTGLGAKDYLNALVAGRNPDARIQDNWDNATDAGRAFMVQSLWNTFKNGPPSAHGMGGAKGQLMKEFPDIGDALQQGLQGRASLYAAQ